MPGPGKRPGDDDKPLPGGEYVRPGGKVDPDAIREAIGAGADEPLDDEESEGLRRVTFKLSRELDKRLDKYLTDRITFMSRNQLQRLIEFGGVTVNGRAPKASTKLHLGDIVEVVVPPPPSSEIQPEDIPINIIHEDDYMLVLNKQPDLIVHPARSHNSGTLLNALAHHFSRSGAPGSLSSVGKEFARPGVVHRLDRHTSGVMVIAKDDEAHWRLGRQFEDRLVDKRYLAIVEGDIGEKLPLADVIDIPMGPHHSRAKGMREKQVVRHDELGKPAVTIYRVRERYHGYTLVELELKTGRTHQIRVHLSHIGFPLVGDDMYGGRRLTARQFFSGIAAGPTDAGLDPSEPLMMRQALHATLLGIRHPITGASAVFTAPLAPDLARLIRLLRAHRPPRSGSIRPDIAGATIDLDQVIAPGADAAL